MRTSSIFLEILHFSTLSENFSSFSTIGLTPGCLNTTFHLGPCNHEPHSSDRNPANQTTLRPKKNQKYRARKEQNSFVVRLRRRERTYIYQGNFGGRSLALLVYISQNDWKWVDVSFCQQSPCFLTKLPKCIVIY